MTTNPTKSSVEESTKSKDAPSTSVAVNVTKPPDPAKSGKDEKQNVVSKVTILGSLAAVLTIVLVATVITYFATRGIVNQTEGPDPDNDKSGMTVEEGESKSDGPSAEDLRLSKAIEPENYILKLKVNLPGYGFKPDETNNLTIEGTVTIKLNVKERTKQIELSAATINITETPFVTVERDDGDVNITVNKLEMREELEKVVIHLENDLEPDRNTSVTVTYTGLISETLGGMYQAKYTTSKGEQKIAAVTQMEPTDARKMVPCFDEPALKATWDVKVIHPTGTDALSNGRNISTKPIGDFTETTFEQTKPMSSYLLAIIVSDFKCVEKNTANKKIMRVCARPDALHMTKYALDAGVKVLDFYENYYGIAFPLQKQDMVAIPDFAAGAMENWGLITYRETDLLYDKQIYSPEKKVRLATVIAHENAHMWFGDLVTMKWWDNLWLNEGFARLTQNIGADHISDHHWNMFDQHVLDSIEDAMAADELASSHPLSFTIEKSREVEEAFDKITYDKGSSVLWMMCQRISIGTFQRGLQLYMNEFQYRNANEDDLWAKLAEAVENVNGTAPVRGPRGILDFPDFAKQWTKQMGFPFVTLSRVSQGKYKVTQERYKPNADAVESEKYRENTYKYKWDIPLWVDEDGQKSEKWLTKDEDLTVNSTAKVVVLNDGGIGFYRTNYESEEDWRAVFSSLPTLSKRTKTRLVSDAFAMAKIGKLNYTTLFEMMTNLKHEKEHMPWEAFMRHFAQVKAYFGNEPEQKMFTAFHAKIYQQMMAKSSIEYVAENYREDKHYYEVMSQTHAIRHMCSSFEDATCISEMKELFEQNVTSRCSTRTLASKCSTVAAPLRLLAYCTNVKYGGAKEFEWTLSMFKKELVALEKNNLLEALTCSRDISSLKQILLDGIRPETNFVRKQDVSSLFTYVAGNDIGEEFLLKFFFEHWEDIKNMKAAVSIIDRIVSICLRFVRTPEQLAEVRSFMKSHNETDSMAIFQKSIESAESRIAWIAKYAKDIVEHLKNTVSV